jgi:hypothetical protein
MSPRPTSIRFPLSLHAQLAATAAAERRSVSNLVLLLVEAGLAERLAAVDPAMAGHGASNGWEARGG